MRSHTISHLGALLLILSLLLASPTNAQQSGNITLMSHPYQLGETLLNIEVYTKPDFTGAGSFPINFLNVHENEYTSVLAAQALLFQRGGKIVRIHLKGERNVAFNFAELPYSFDPNRIFTEKGVRATLELNSRSPVSQPVVDAVLQFGQKLLEYYEYNSTKAVVSIHNNFNLNAFDYLPGGQYENEAADVHYVKSSNPHNFFFVTQDHHFDELKNMGFNVILQQKDLSKLTDDGSLSVLSSFRGRPYINVEAYHGQYIEQLYMMDNLMNIFAESPTAAFQRSSALLSAATVFLVLICIAIGVVAAVLVFMYKTGRLGISLTMQRSGQPLLS